MAYNVPATINQSGTVSGFTTATWGTTKANQNIPNGVLYVVSAKGGTQPSAVDIHSASRPFSVLLTAPQSIQALPGLNNAGVLPYVPVNSYSIGTKKGVLVLAGQPSASMTIKTGISVPSGADAADPDNVAAAILSHASLLVQMAQEIINTAKSGVG